ncbi:hypothetical protein Tco_0704862 [Tanacetum coccineum]|uniref:Xylulose kinase-1 n=1 Tax=Tanacetum coccineum TaxID=301880 RepID=A0ABQ4Y3T5_9ASTR
MTTLQFADTHNLVMFLTKSAESEGFEQIVDFLNASSIKYALTVNPTIYTSCIEQFWSTVKAKMVNGEVQLQALVDGKKIVVTEASVRRDLQLKDVDGVDMDCQMLIIFEQITLMGKQKSRRPKEKDTEIPQYSVPTQRLQAQEQEELSDAEKATLFIQLLEKRRKHFATKRAEEKRNRPPIKAQQRSFMCTYLKNMEGWKPKDLKNKSFANIQDLFDKAMKRVNTFVDMDIELVKESSKKAEAETAQESSSKRAGEALEQESSKKQKVEMIKKLKSLSRVWKSF